MPPLAVLGAPNVARAMLPIAPSGAVEAAIGDSAAQAATVSDSLVSITLPPQSEIIDLPVRWTYADDGQTYTYDQVYRVVSDVLFTVLEARAFGDGELADEEAYLTAAIEFARERITEEFTGIIGYELGKRRKSHEFYASRVPWVFLPDTYVTSIVAASDPDGSALDVSTLSVEPTGFVQGISSWYGKHKIEYVCGADIPLALKRAALTLLRSQAVPTDVDNRALTFTDQLGTYRLSAAGRAGAWFGIPDVDSVLDRYASNVGGMR